MWAGNVGDCIQRQQAKERYADGYDEVYEGVAGIQAGVNEGAH